MNSNLILRVLNSPWITPEPDITKGSVLSHDDVDNNFIYLKGEVVYTAQTLGSTITLKKINGNDISFDIGGSGGSGVYWTSGSTGNGSIRVVNGGTTDSEGDYSLVTGFDNLISSLGGIDSADNSSIIGGNQNTLDRSNDSSIIGGNLNFIRRDNKRSLILGGHKNQMLGLYNTSISGITTSDNSIIGGSDNTVANSSNSGILGGLDNVIESTEGNLLIQDTIQNSHIIAGRDNVISPSHIDSVILGGRENSLVGNRSNPLNTNIDGIENGILGGYQNKISYVGRNGIVGGTNNLINGEGNPTNNVICGGDSNHIKELTNINSFIAGGVNNTIDAELSTPSRYSPNSAIIAGSGNTIFAESTETDGNIVIIGGNNITATSKNTVYVPNLEVTGQAYTPIHDNLTGSTSFIPDWNNSNVQILTLSGNTSISGGIATMKGGSSYTMIVKQSNGGSHSITWDSTYKWEDGLAPDLTYADGSVDILTFICDGTNLHGLIAKNFQ